MAERVNFLVYRGDDRLVRFTMTTNGTVAGWTTQLTVRRTPASADPPVLVVAGAIVDGGSVSTPGVFEVLLTKAQLIALQARDHAYSFKRTDAGAAEMLTEGTMTVKADILNAL